MCLVWYTQQFEMNTPACYRLESVSQNILCSQFDVKMQQHRNNWCAFRWWYKLLWPTDRAHMFSTNNCFTTWEFVGVYWKNDENCSTILFHIDLLFLNANDKWFCVAIFKSTFSCEIASNTFFISFVIFLEYHLVYLESCSANFFLDVLLCVLQTHVHTCWTY